MLYDRDNNKHLAPRKARQGACVVGRSKLKDTDTISYALDLNEANVQAIFQRCLKTAETNEIEYAVLFRKEFGYEKTENPVHFDLEKINTNKQTIKYLFGQVQIVHRNEFSITEEKAATRYDGTKWTSNHGFLMMFLHLAAGAHIMGPFIADGQKASTVKLSPTLSPKDPAFPAWWEQHRAEWED